VATDTVTERDLIAADVRTTEGDVNLLDDIKDTDLFKTVRGTNPNTGASSGLIQRVANDPVLSHLALVLRRMPVGSFQALNGDLRTVEASCKAAVAFTEMFGEHDLEFKKAPKKEDTPDVKTDSTRHADDEHDKASTVKK